MLSGGQSALRHRNALRHRHSERQADRKITLTYINSELKYTRKKKKQYSYTYSNSEQINEKVTDSNKT